MLSPAPNPAQGQTLPVIQFDDDLQTINEPQGSGNDTPVLMTVVTDQVLTQAVTVQYQLTGSSNTATPNQDYRLPSNSTLTIPVGSSSAQIMATVIDDDKIEKTERFVLKITNPTGATLVDDHH